MLLHWIRKAAIESKYKTEAHHHTVGGLLMRDSQPAKHTHKCHRFCSLILVSVELHLSQIVMERTILCHFRMAIYGFDRKECNASVTIVMPLYVFLCSSLLDCLVMVLLILIAVQTVAIDGQTLFTATCYTHTDTQTVDCSRGDGYCFAVCGFRVVNHLSNVAVLCEFKLWFTDEFRWKLPN